MLMNFKLGDTISLLALVCSTIGIFLTLLTLREMQKQRLLSIKPKLILKLKDNNYCYSNNPSCTEKYEYLEFGLRNIGSGSAWKIEIVSKINVSFIPEDYLIFIQNSEFIMILIDKNSTESFMMDMDDDATYDVLVSGEEVRFFFMEITSLVYTVISLLLRDKKIDELYDLEGKDAFTAYVNYSDIIGKKHSDIYSLQIKTVGVADDEKSVTVDYIVVPQKTTLKSRFVKKATREQDFNYMCNVLEIFANSKTKQK